MKKPSQTYQSLQSTTPYPPPPGQVFGLGLISWFSFGWVPSNFISALVTIGLPTSKLDHHDDCSSYFLVLWDHRAYSQILYMYVSCVKLDIKNCFLRLIYEFFFLAHLSRPGAHRWAYNIGRLNHLSSVVHTLQTSSPQNPLGQPKPNFI